MNKKTIITILLALVAMAGQGQKQVVWEKPAAFMGAYNSTFEITKVELKQTETGVVAGTDTWVRHRRPRKFVKYLAVSSIFLLSFKELHYKIW